jgi:coenzyme Q-binding protein COQ10
MGHVRDSIHVGAPAGDVVEFAADPRHWATYMASMSEPDRIVGDGDVGTRAEFTLLMAGLSLLNESWRVTEARRDSDGGGHWGLAIEGPATGWQTWDYVPEGDGTRVTLEVESALPACVLGRIADRRAVDKLVARDVRHSLQAMRLLMEWRSD